MTQIGISKLEIGFRILRLLVLMVLILVVVIAECQFQIILQFNGGWVLALGVIIVLFLLFILYFSFTLYSFYQFVRAASRHGLKPTKVLTRHCQYYGGEESCPSGVKRTRKEMFWNLEKKWADSHGIGFEEETFVYTQMEMEEIMPIDSIPLSLKALLLNRYLHWFSTPNGIESDKRAFRDWYLKFYLDGI